MAHGGLEGWCWSLEERFVATRKTLWGLFLMCGSGRLTVVLVTCGGDMGGEAGDEVVCGYRNLGRGGERRKMIRTKKHGES